MEDGQNCPQKFKVFGFPQYTLFKRIAPVMTVYRNPQQSFYVVQLVKANRGSATVKPGRGCPEVFRGTFRQNEPQNNQTLAEDAASDLVTFIEAFLGIRILLLAFQECNVLRLASRRDMLRRRSQHRQRRDRISCCIHRARHLQPMLHP
ncbi:hypothetical protein LWI29_017573 [Acer saccharum]|uniref:Uncharacterized protein n=1 Tax=Acer saccharum TaxID=4024 RepID=A0AA39SLV7_ACESA|nr:hypothetical protein LWI29_017573 [Acer saccharum]